LVRFCAKGEERGEEKRGKKGVGILYSLLGEKGIEMEVGFLHTGVGRRKKITKERRF